MKTSYLFIFLFLSLQSPAQIIKTIAGNGTVGYSGDAGPAIAAEFSHPIGIVFDAMGNLYIVDNINERIRKIDTTGIITTIAGNGTAGYTMDGIPATAAEFNYPVGIAIDGAGNLYIADGSNNRIREINTSGIISTVAGNGTPGYSGDGGQATAASLYLPYGVCVDNPGNIYIADRFNNCIRKVDPSGIITTIAGNGTPGFSGDGSPASAALLNSPTWVAADAVANIYIADHNNNRVRKINGSGIITTIAGTGGYGYSGDGVPATATEVTIVALSIDSAGNIFMGDESNARVRKINTSGIISTIAGNGIAGFSGDNCLATSAELNSPYDVIADHAGNVYFSDFGNQRIREIVMNHTPVFMGGNSQTISVCENTVDSINSLLAMTDADTGQTETWSVLATPAHGAVVGSYSALSTTGVVTPTGLYYTPTTGYTGLDTFKITVTDCANASDTTTICVHVVVPLVASPIMGADTVCKGDTIVLTDVLTGGAWSATNVAAAVSAGVVTGAVVGIDTIRYTVTNVCGAVVASHMVTVKNCVTESVSSLSPGIELLQVWPSPNEGTFAIKLTSDFDGDAQFVITNLIGQKMREFNAATNKEVEISLGAPPDMYFVTATTSHGRQSAKVLVQ